MKFAELVKKNRSTRAFDGSREITREELIALVDLAHNSPSANNRQPLRYFLSCDKETNALIQGYTHWAGLLKDIKLPPENMEPAAFIVIYVDKNICPNVQAAGKDVGIAAQTIMLGATEMGLSGCMIGAFDRPLNDALDMGEDYEISLLVALGKPNEEIRIIESDGDTAYYREGDLKHVVPKLKLEKIILN